MKTLKKYDLNKAWNIIWNQERWKCKTVSTPWDILIDQIWRRINFPIFDEISIGICYGKFKK
jgi:hexokinase